MSDKTPENPVTPPTPPAPDTTSGPAQPQDAASATEHSAGEPPLLDEQIADAGAVRGQAPAGTAGQATGKKAAQAGAADEAAQKSKAGKRAAPPRKPPVRGRRRWLGPLLLLLLLALAAFFAWQWWENLQQQQHGWRSAVATLERDQARLRADMAASRDASASRLAEIEAALQSAVTAAPEPAEAASGAADGALLDEAITLAVLAQQQLLLTGDVSAARRLLAVADEVITQASEPALVAVREALAVDMQRLAAADHLDLTALILRLNGLQAQVPALVVPRHEQVRAGAQKVAPQGDGFWARLWARLPVRVRDHGSDVPLPLDADSQQLLRLHLESALQEARLGLLQSRGVIFEAALARADGVVQQWFAPGDPAVVAFREALAELQAVPVARAVPEIDQGLSLMRQLRQSRQSWEAR